MLKPIFIAIAGPSGSGKTELANTVCNEICSDEGVKSAIVISEDAYYRDQSHLPSKERDQINYDHPSAFDYDLLDTHLTALKNDQAIEVPVYDYTSHTRSTNTRTVEPAPIVVLEGIMILANKTLLRNFSYKIYVDTPIDICLARRIRRDTQSRGRDLDSILDQYEQFVRPMCEQYVMPSRSNSDLIVPRGGKNRAAIEMIKSHLLNQSL